MIFVKIVLPPLPFPILALSYLCSGVQNEHVVAVEVGSFDLVALRDFVEVELARGIAETEEHALVLLLFFQVGSYFIISKLALIILLSLFSF